MSFYKSLNQLLIKIEQKNIILISGNINEIIDSKSNNLKKINQFSESSTFIPVIDYLGKILKLRGYDFIEKFIPHKGSLIITEENEIQKDKNLDEFDNDEDINVPFSSYINQITNKIKNFEETKKNFSSAFIIDCSEIFFDKSGNGILPEKLAELLSAFIYSKEQNSFDYLKNKTKLILLSRSAEIITNLIPINNVEFASVILRKPDFFEREEFFQNHGLKFLHVKDTINDHDSEDFKNGIQVTESLSFREIIQLSKIPLDEDDKLTIKQLYALATFNKKDSEWEKISIEKMNQLDSFLNGKVKGQNRAIEKTKLTMIRSFVGLSGITHSTSNNNKPKGTLFFSGPTGVGKTELAKAICEFIYGNESKLIRFDMSEYNHESSDQKLIGAPPGYVGYDVGGQLTNAVKEKPFSILLFDEIEKAHSKILDKFLQILEDGRLTSSQGEIIDFSETFIIFTSNIGSKNADVKVDDIDLNEKHFIKSVIKYFKDDLGRPEILNRIGLKNIVPFNFIRDDKIINDIIESKIKTINDSIMETKKIKFTNIFDVKDQLFSLIKSSCDIEFGGRGIISEIETKYVDELSKFIFKNHTLIRNNFQEKKIINISIKINNNKIEFSII